MRMMKSPMAVRNPSTSGETETQKIKLKLLLNISTLLSKDFGIILVKKKLHSDYSLSKACFYTNQI